MVGGGCSNSSKHDLVIMDLSTHLHLIKNGKGFKHCSGLSGKGNACPDSRQTREEAKEREETEEQGQGTRNKEQDAAAGKEPAMHSITNGHDATETTEPGSGADYAVR